MLTTTTLEEEMTKIELAKKIETFLATYGKKSAQEENEWASPDAAELEACAKLLRADRPITRFPWSEWGSGGYGPYTSSEGRREHQEILKLIDDYRCGMFK